jgi:translation initiation factor IF-2
MTTASKKTEPHKKAAAAAAPKAPVPKAAAPAKLPVPKAPAPAKPAAAKAPAPAKAPKPPKEPQPKHKLELREGTTLGQAAELLKLRQKELLGLLESKGVVADLDDFVDERIAEALAKATEREVELLPVEEVTRRLARSRPEELVSRPPVVTIMGHVDHGKTTLLDAVRSSNLVDKEFGGITQHIGAYQVRVKGRPVTFIDTPGHEAFTRLRARGAKVTDIVVLVVAADDGVMPQTKEAISHAKAAEIPIIVALNKIDKPEANPDRVKQQLSKEGLLIEEWGGKTICVEVSAKEKKNIGELMEMILLLGDILELKANPGVPAQGVVLEARLDAKKGPLATVLIQQGTLQTGQAFVSGLTYGKVRALFDEAGKPVRSTGPGAPVEVMGFSEVPVAGDVFQVTDDAESARRVVEFRKSRLARPAARPEAKLSLEDLFKKIEGGEGRQLNLIVKADVQGSVEVLNDLLPKLETEKVKISIIHSATGTVTEADVLLASASKAIIIAYNVRPQPNVLDLAKTEGVEVRDYRVIYQLTDDIKKAVLGLLEPVIKETYLGRAEVRRVFQIPRVGAIAGCFVQDGRIARNAEARVLRNGKPVFEGRVSSLKHLKENVAEVRKEYECGIGLDRFQEFEPGDIIEAFVREKVRPV